MEVIKGRYGTAAGPVQEVEQTVKNILRMVKEKGDSAIAELTLRYDGVELKQLKVPKEAVVEAYSVVPRSTVEALRFAAEQVRFFAQQQLSCLKELECSNVAGVVLGHRLVPVDSCGAYVPGGRYPLPSSALMSIIPAKVAGVRRVAACSPPSKEHGGIHPAVLVAMDIAGADEIYCMGGAQAIAAFAYGTSTVAKVDIIVGPGNVYVTEAKRQVIGRVGIDLLAGPSEALIIADETAPPRFVAVDLLARCEHDPSSRAILLTTSRELAENVMQLVEEELASLPTRALAASTWEANGQVILVDSLEEAVQLADEVAPEHLQLMTSRNDELFRKVRNYGGLFMGSYAPVAFGDYCSGTNHILPTMGCARFANGLWVGTFIKVCTYQKVTAEGAAVLSPVCSRLAATEGLAAHQRAAELRGDQAAP
jgi:histidinol dehydrogenase/sulfopropanediol 3-dehydrogenase